MKLKRLTALCMAATMTLQITGCAGNWKSGNQTAGANASTEETAEPGTEASEGSKTGTANAGASTDSKTDTANAGASEGSKTDSANAEASEDSKAEADASQENKETAAPVIGDSLSREGYTLEQVVVLSRHNIRSPLSGKGSALDTLTPYDWIEWSSNPSELSVRGGILETEMGQYFRKWLEKEELFPENYRPTEDEVRIYANSKQRTIATANFFKSGLLPVADTETEYHAEYDTMDPVFEPKLTFVSDEYCRDATAEMLELYDEASDALEEEYELLSDVIDVEKSQDYKDGKFTGFVLDDVEVVLEEGKEPGMTGSIKTATGVSDALVLQYYEGDEETEAFGKELSRQQWEDIAEIKDIYQDVLFKAPLIAANVANPLLTEIESELGTVSRKFTFLCGHDSNIGSVLAALRAEDYDLPGAIEKNTPIGCKLLFSRFTNDAGEEYIGLDMVCQTTEQLKEMPILDLANPPACCHIELQGLTANADGLYEADLVEGRIREAIGQYQQIEEEYSMDAAA